MSCDNSIAIRIRDVHKYFEMYEKASHRLWQMLYRGRRQFFRPFWALKDISFDVSKGECVGIIGRNGAGKSTLLQIITGTLNPSSGYVEVTGRVAALLELGSGFNPEFTGKENIYLNASILGLSKQEIDAKYEDIVAFADIGEFIHQPVKSYSSGMSLRLAFSVIAHVDADVLIVDEALAVGDAFFTQKCMRFLREFMREHTVLFVSHDVAAVNSLCNRAVLLEGGQVKAIGSPKEITEIYLEDTYEAVQGKSTSTKKEKKKTPPTPGLFLSTENFRDMRQDIINASPLRNDIEVFQFEEQGASFGKADATIENAVLTNSEGTPLSWIVGGEMVTLRILCRAHREILRPIVGFFLKDRLGQTLMGDNTYIAFKETPLAVPAGKYFAATFSFRMPILAVGEYFFTIAIAEGTQESHVQHQWRHEALMITSVTTSAATGLMGIPMQNLTLDIVDGTP